MRSRLVSITRVVLLPTVALAFVLAFVPSQSTLAVRTWLLVLLALAVVVGLGALRRAYPADPGLLEPRTTRRDGPANAFPSLERVEREVALGAASAHDTHFRLRPTVRATATELLSTRRSVSLDRQPERARELLGDDAWELVRPDRPSPESPRGPGLDRAALERIVSALEAL